MSGTPPISVKAFKPNLNDLRNLKGRDVDELETQSVGAGYDHASATRVLTTYLDNLITKLIPAEKKTGELQATIADTAANLAKYSFAAMQSLKDSGDPEHRIQGSLNRDIMSLSESALIHINKGLGFASKLKVRDLKGDLGRAILAELKKPPAAVVQKPEAESTPAPPEATNAAVAADPAADTDTKTRAIDAAQTVDTHTTSTDTTPIDQLLDEFAEEIKNPLNGMAKLTAAVNKDPVALLTALAKITLPAESEAIKVIPYLMADGGKNLSAVKSFIDDNLSNKNFTQKLEQLASTEPEKAAAVKVYLKYLEQHLGEYGTINLTRGLSFSKANRGILEGLKQFLPESIQTQITSDADLEKVLSTVTGLQSNPAKTLELVRDFRNEIAKAEKLDVREREAAKLKASEALLVKVKAAAENKELNTKDIAIINMAVLGNHEIKDKQDRDVLEQMKATLKEKFNIDGINKEQVLKVAGVGLSAIVAVGMFFPGVTHAVMGMAGGLVQMGGMALVGKLFGGSNGGGFADALKFQAMNSISDFGQGKSE